MPYKKITYTEFLSALDLVMEYHSQTKTQSKIQKKYSSKVRTIDLTGKLSFSMLKVLTMYYKLYYGVEINDSNLSRMHINLLACIDYNELKKYRGIGDLGILKMQKIIEFNLEQQLD
jgi:hypothetical protein